MLKAGERAGFFLSAHGGVLKLVGFGVYEGEFIPPAELSQQLHKLCVANPRIKLDDSDVQVYGFEGYWCSESKLKELQAKFEADEGCSVVVVDMEQYRKENQQ